MFHFKILKELKEIFRRHTPGLGGLEILKFIGPGFLVTVGFIDPGNWASNMAAGSNYGYGFLWVVTLSTLMLIALQHNAAHLGIVTGLCLSEACAKYFNKWASSVILWSAILASISTALAELLGAAIGLKMLLGLPIGIGAVFSAGFVAYMVFSNSYKKLERWIIGFVSLIGLSFLFELSLIHIEWNVAVKSWFVPALPAGSLPILMSVLGAVVMPHNIFLHSEIIQSRQWNLEGEEVIKRQLKYEITDTLSAMSAGWAINSAMILVAASVFHTHGVLVTELEQAHATLRPILGNLAAAVFGIALLLAGLSSAVTASIAGGSIFSGMFMEPLDLTDTHSRTGVLITLAGALAVIFFLTSPFTGLIWSQIVLSIQLPLTVLPLIMLTSSRAVMGKYANNIYGKALLWAVAAVVVFLNIMLLIETVRPNALKSITSFLR